MQTVADMRGVGVKNRGKFADVLCGRPLMSPLTFIHLSISWTMDSLKNNTIPLCSQNAMLHAFPKTTKLEFQIFASCTYLIFLLFLQCLIR